jgi:hypothetical protein
VLIGSILLDTHILQTILDTNKLSVVVSGIQKPTESHRRHLPSGWGFTTMTEMIAMNWRTPSVKNMAWRGAWLTC